MKTLALVLAAIVLLFVVVLFAAPEPVDLAGVWKGKTGVPSGETDEVTLTLEKSEDTYKGKLSDSLGMVTECPLDNFAFADGKMSFDFYLDSGECISTVLTLTEDKLIGSWSDAGGASGSLELSREAK